MSFNQIYTLNASSQKPAGQNTRLASVHYSDEQDFNKDYMDEHPSYRSSTDAQFYPPPNQSSLDFQRLNAKQSQEGGAKANYLLIIQQLMDKVQRLMQELKEANDISQSLIVQNRHLQQQYSVLKGKFQSYVQSDDESNEFLTMQQYQNSLAEKDQAVRGLEDQVQRLLHEQDMKTLQNTQLATQVGLLQGKIDELQRCEQQRLSVYLAENLELKKLLEEQSRKPLAERTTNAYAKDNSAQLQLFKDSEKEAFAQQNAPLAGPAHSTHSTLNGSAGVYISNRQISSPS